MTLTEITTIATTTQDRDLRSIVDQLNIKLKQIKDNNSTIATDTTILQALSFDLSKVLVDQYGDVLVDQNGYVLLGQ